MWRFSGQIITFVGEMGSGKTLNAFRHALYLMEEEKRQKLICNFSVNGAALCSFLCRNGFYRTLKIFQNGGIICRSAFPDGKLDLEYFLGSDTSAVYIWDEAGAMANRRYWRDVSPRAIQALTQLRKFNRRIIWTAQFFDQVEDQLRELTSDIVLCRGATRYNSSLDAPELRFIFNRLYQRQIYLKRIHNTKFAEGRFSSIMMSIIHSREWEFRKISDDDCLLLSACNSLSEVSQQPVLTNPWLPSKIQRIYG